MAAAAMSSPYPMPMPRSTIKAIEALIKAGGTITDAYKAGMVNSKRLGRYFKAHPAWEAKIRKLSQANGDKKKGRYLRERTHCVNGHAFAEFGRTAWDNHEGAMRRHCQKCRTIFALNGGVVRPDVVKKVEAKLSAGASPGSFTRSNENRITDFYTFKKLCRDNPKIDALVKKHRAGNSSVGQTLRYARERGLPPELEPTLIAVARLKHKIKTIRQQPKKETP